jgi:hypothetical protein
VQAEPGVAGQPGPDDGGLVGGEVVADQVHAQAGGDGLVDPARNFLNSAARWWRRSWEITVPPAMPYAANRSVVPCRTCS